LLLVARLVFLPFESVSLLFLARVCFRENLQATWPPDHHFVIVILLLSADQTFNYFGTSAGSSTGRAQMARLTAAPPPPLPVVFLSAALRLASSSVTVFGCIRVIMWQYLQGRITKAVWFSDIRALTRKWEREM
jgi:hypothetical protein